MVVFSYKRVNNLDETDDCNTSALHVNCWFHQLLRPKKKERISNKSMM